jgi:hypothetical protein
MMAAIRDPDESRWLSDRQEMLRFLEQEDVRTGFVFDPKVTPEKVRELMMACGIRPEDNLFSRDIIQAKYPDEEE